MNSTYINTYDFVVKWLEKHDCKFCDNGGYSVPHSSDKIYAPQPDNFFLPEIVVFGSPENDYVVLAIRAWINDVYNIETPPQHTVSVQTPNEAKIALESLYASLLVLNEMQTRYKDILENS